MIRQRPDVIDARDRFSESTRLQLPYRWVDGRLVEIRPVTPLEFVACGVVLLAVAQLQMLHELYLLRRRARGL